jgi:type I restriction enzyme S subunit
MTQQSKWTSTQLGNLAEFINGRAFKKEEWTSEGYPIIRIQNLTGSRDEYNYFGGDLDENNIVRDGDLLVSWSATIDAFIYKGSLAALNQHIYKVLPNVDKKFLFYLISNIRNELIAKTHGTGMKHITKTKFLAHPVMYPEDPNEQQRIVDRIEEIFSKIDAGSSGLTETKKLITGYWESLLVSVFNQDSNRLIKLEEIIDEGPQNGLYLPKSEYGEGTPILRIENYQAFSSEENRELKKVNAQVADIRRYSLRSNDVVINRVNSLSHLGKTLHVNDKHLPAIFESNMMRLSVNNTAAPRYVYYYLNSPLGKRELVKSAKHAVNQASINQNDVKNVKIPLPSIQTQEEIVRTLDTALSKIEALRKNLNQSTDLSNTLYQSTLKRAFDGSLT